MLSFVSSIHFINGSIFKYNSYCHLTLGCVWETSRQEMKFLVNGYPEWLCRCIFLPMIIFEIWEGKQSKIAVQILHVILCFWNGITGLLLHQLLFPLKNSKIKDGFFCRTNCFEVFTEEVFCRPSTTASWMHWTVPLQPGHCFFGTRLKNFLCTVLAK